MEQYRKTMVTFGVLVIVLFGLYYFTDWFSKTTGYVLGEDEKIKLALCLTDKDAKFYTSSTCPDCDDQLDIFGDTSRLLNVVTCLNVEDCPEGGVPSWTIGKQTVYGVKSFDELIRLSGCDLNKAN